jgi:hypothetical protein
MAEDVTIGLVWLRIAAVEVPGSVKSGVRPFERQYVPFWLCLIAFGSLGNSNMATVRNFASL